MVGSPEDSQAKPGYGSDRDTAANPESVSDIEDEFAGVEEALSYSSTTSSSAEAASPQTQVTPLAMVETAFLASTSGLLWLASYYLSLVPWMRIFFPIPIALVYLRWGNRAAWICALVTGLLLSVLMGPYLSLLFLLPYGILGVQLGALWKRRSTWLVSISLGTLVSTLSFFFRVWLLSIFLGEDLWVYLTSRIADFLEWIVTLLVGWGLLGIGALGSVNLNLVQIATVGVIFLSDFVYLFTVHLAAWLIMGRLGASIPEPPGWVQVLLEEE